MLKGQKKGEKSGIFRKCLTCEVVRYVKPHLISTWKFCSIKCRGIDKRGKVGVRLGSMPSLETREKQSESHKGQATWNKGLKGFRAGEKHNWMPSGEKHWSWKGGITPINQKIRHSMEYEEWRTKVFERDDYTCQHCGAIGEYLNADHIKPFAYYPELRFDIDNGRTLCVPCHAKTDTYKGRAVRFKREVKTW